MTSRQELEIGDVEKGSAISQSEVSSQSAPPVVDTTRIAALSQSQSESQSRSRPQHQPQSQLIKKNVAVKILLFLKEQWFLITMAILIAISSQHQVPQAHQKAKSTIVSYVCVSVIFFITGCTIKTKTLVDNYARWKIHLWVQIQCFLLTSAVMFGVVSAAATNRKFMDPALLVGMILTGCMATTISSNVVMTGQAHGNQALTVVQSTLGNFLAPFLTPLLFKAYLSTGAWYTKILPDEPKGYSALYERVFKQLGLSVFLPMVVGQLVQYLWPNMTKTVCSKYKVSKLGSIALLIIIWQTYDSAFSSKAAQSMKASNACFIIFMSIGLFTLFLFLSLFTSRLWLDKVDTVAICYCVPAKTPAMGVPMSTVLFVNLPLDVQAKLQLPLVLYQGLQILAGTILTGPFKKWVDG